jgi:DNA-binding transcriptional LysR family regulator
VIRSEDLIGIPLLMVKRPYLRNEMANWFGESFDQMEIASTYNLIYNAAMMVKDHVGVALCIELESQFDGLCFRPLSPNRETGNVIVWKEVQTLPAPTQAFIEYIKTYLSSITDDT